jgi:hypothetical protein
MRRRFLVATMRGLRHTDPLALANTRLLLRCAMGRRDRHVAVHLDKGAKKRAAETAKGGVRLAIFLSSLVLQSRLDVPDHSRGRLFRNFCLYAPFSKREAISSSTVASPP